MDTVEECGVKQNRITVTYRFRQPGQAMSLALPQSYSTGRVIRIPLAPRTAGEHIRKKRLGLKMLYKMSQNNSVWTTNVFNWEGNRSVPEIRYRPAIIGFLLYDPPPKANTPGEQLVRQRTSLGLSQKEAPQPFSESLTFHSKTTLHFRDSGVIRSDVPETPSHKGSSVRPLSGKIGAQAGMPGRYPKRT